MGEVLQKNFSKESATFECTDIFVDLDKYILECEEKGIKKENIRIFLTEEPEIHIDLVTLDKLKKALEKLTSDVNSLDSEEEKFAKITSSIRKNITYALEKTKSRNIGNGRNFVEGLLKGRCVCSGYALITKMALEMHGIESEVVSNQIHAWNEVKLRDDWYNWDMTNVKADTLTATTMGKCLKSDEQLKGKIYENKSSNRSCKMVASKDLIDTINLHIKYNMKNIPKLPKENFMSKISKKLNGFLNKFGMGKQKLLEEGNIHNNTHLETAQTAPNNHSSLEFTKFSPVLLFEDRNSALWEIQSWDKGSIDNKVQTSYVELPMIGNPDSIMKENREEFLAIYEALLKDSGQNNTFIGRISIIPSDFENEKHFCGDSFKSKECEYILDKVKVGIEMNEKRKKVLQQSNEKYKANLENERDKRDI